MSEGRRRKGRARQGRKEEERQHYVHDLRVKPRSQLLGPLCGAQELLLSYH